MKTITIALLIIVTFSVSAQDSSEAVDYYDHNTSLGDFLAEGQIDDNHIVFTTQLGYCFACWIHHTLEDIECECPLDNTHPPKCGLRHFGTYCHRTGIYYVLENSDNVFKQYKGKEGAKRIKILELSGYADRGVLVYEVVRELPPITDWTGLEIYRRIPEEELIRRSEEIYKERFVRK